MMSLFKPKSVLLVAPCLGCGQDERITEFATSTLAISKCSLAKILQAELYSSSTAITSYIALSSRAPSESVLVVTDLELLTLLSSQLCAVTLGTLSTCIPLCAGLVGVWTGSTAPMQNLQIIFDRVEAFQLPSLQQRISKLKSLGLDDQKARVVGERTPGASFTKLERIVHLDMLPLSNKKHIDDQWNGVIGYDSVKDCLTRLIHWRLERQDELSAMGIEPVSGIILHGPSGCGKTKLAMSFANDMRLNFCQIKASDVFSKWFGESEKLLRDAFAKARMQAPCILFLDQVDVIAPRRSAAGHDAGGVGARVLSTLLNELDGVDSQRDGLIVLAATSRIDAVDEAALRPGRLGYLIEMGLPSRHDGVNILRHMLAPLDTGIDPSEFSLQGMTGADIEAFFNKACWRAFRRGAPELQRCDFVMDSFVDDDGESL